MPLFHHRYKDKISIYFCNNQLHMATYTPKLKAVTCW